MDVMEGNYVDEGMVSSPVRPFFISRKNSEHLKIESCILRTLQRDWTREFPTRIVRKSSTPD
jgi:hypothetical protein